MNADEIKPQVSITLTPYKSPEQLLLEAIVERIDRAEANLGAAIQGGHPVGWIVGRVDIHGDVEYHGSDTPVPRETAERHLAEALNEGSGWEMWTVVRDMRA